MLNLKSGSVVALGIVLVALFYRRSDDLEERMDKVLHGLLRAEKKGHKSQPVTPKVAIGFGGCLDIITEGIEVLEAAKIPIPDKPKHFNSIRSADDLGKAFAYFFQHGAAGERYVHDKTLFRDLEDVVYGHLKHRTALGGNAPVMAKRMSNEGCDVLLGAFLSRALQKEVGTQIKMAGNTLEKDDVHMLLEYPKDATWGKYSTPRANRFIVHSDESNPTLASLEAFAEEVVSFSPHLMVVGGLQMMDNFPFKQGVMEERLGKLQQLLSNTLRSTKIHFEMASFADELLLKELLTTVVPYSDSLGMNEQELPNLHGMMSHGNITLISDPYPRVATTLDHMRAVWKVLRATGLAEGHRPLTRLHVHTLAYQVIMVAHGSGWRNTMAATAKASLTANRHVCGNPTVDVKKARLIMDESFSTARGDGATRKEVLDERPVTCWDEEDYEMCITPVLVCTEVLQTGGGGDNVSSAGLVLQI